MNDKNKNSPISYRCSISLEGGEMKDEKMWSEFIFKIGVWEWSNKEWKKALSSSSRVGLTNQFFDFSCDFFFAVRVHRMFTQ